MPIPVLQTRRLILRPFHPADAAVVHSLAGMPEVALTTQNIPHPYKDGVAEQWIRTHGPAWEEGRCLTLAITSGQDGVLGAVSLKLNATDRRGELGYWVGRPFWNLGVATEAAAKLIDFGFEVLELNRIQARHLTRNPASGRVMEKLAMTPEGVLRQSSLVRGRFEDLAIYAILALDRAERGVARSAQPARRPHVRDAG